MPHPKHRFSQTRTAKRRTHDSLEKAQLTTCSNCCNVSPRMPRMRLLPRQTCHREERRGLSLDILRKRSASLWEAFFLYSYARHEHCLTGASPECVNRAGSKE